MTIPHILIVAGIAVIIIALLAARGSGPRVTQIKRTRHHDEGGDNA